MTDRTVIGADAAVADPDLGTQTFMGATVVDFSCNSSWDSQGASCTINLIEDVGQRVDKDSVVGQPQYFEIVNTAGDLVFCFYGILKDISRTVSPNGERKYSATLQSPTVLLQASSVITDIYAGPGDAEEAVAPNVPSDLEFGHANSQVNFAGVYNLLNAFGVFENDDLGVSSPAGFGASQLNAEGMRLDSFVFAIDALINGSNASNPNLGRPIIYGADTWGNNPNPYYYTFDINGFIDQISSFIPYDYRVKSTTLMDFVAELCTELNFVYMVDLRKPSGKGNAGIVGPFGVATDNASEGTGTFGGQIHIITQNRNVYSATKFPLAFQLVRREISDKGTGGALIAFSNGLGEGFGGNDLPLDFAWDGDDIHPGGPPNASSPFGGSAPFEDITQDSIERYTQTNLQVSLNEDAVGGKVVVGGFQSRIGFVPNGLGITDPLGPGGFKRGHVYQYWGSIARLDNFGSNASLSDTSQKGIPIVTTPLNIQDARDLILIDIQSLRGAVSIIEAVYSGIYPCSMAEMAAAMHSYASWDFWMSNQKPGKLGRLHDYFGGKLNEVKKRFFNPNGTLTYAGIAFEKQGLSTLASFNTSSDNSALGSLNCNDPVAAVAEATYEAFKQKLHAIIKNTGDTHYGKSWLVQAPASTSKLDENDETVVGDFVTSWEISDDAYLEPANFAASEAPQSPFFVNNGRVKSYVNYDASFTTLEFPYQTLTGFGTVTNYDFSEYASSKLAQTTLAGGDSIFGFPIEVDKNYYFLPTAYFSQYSESNFTHFQTVAPNGNWYIDPAARAATSFGVNNSECAAATSYILGAGSLISPGGVGMYPYYLCTTNKVSFPLPDSGPAFNVVGKRTKADFMSNLTNACEAMKAETKKVKK